MAWWLWIALGLLLAAIELLTPGLFLIFFAIAALTVGAITLAGVLPAAWLQWLLFPVVALVTLRLFRQPLMARLQQNDGGDRVDSLIGELALPADAIPAGGHGRAELRGSSWNVRNAATGPLAAGQRCRVVGVNGLMLDIRPE
jgi:membrane protein implicated in regulation of membrane protease activity